MYIAQIKYEFHYTSVMFSISLILKNHSAQKPKENFKILTKAKFEDQSNNVSAKISKCGSPKCGICYNIIEGYKFQFKNGPLFEVKTNMDCSSKNFLYVIKCERCGEDYIGETGNELRKRMTVHRQQIRDPTINMIPLSAHLHVRTCAKDKKNYFTLFLFYNLQTTQLNKNEF